MNNSNVVIIGDGAVGSTLAYTLLNSNYVSKITIIDMNKSKAEGDALDMMHGIPFVSPKKIEAGDYTSVADAHVVVITAGVGQKEGETRIDLLKRNIKVFDSIIDSMKPYVHKDLIVLVVTNPVDILSYYTYKKLGLPSNQVIGSGTVLDTARLRTMISEEAHVDPRNVHAYILGEHGDSEVAAWSVTNIGGLPLLKFCERCGTCKKDGLTRLEELHENVKNAAYEIIAKKGSTFYAVGLAVSKIIKSIVNDTNSVLTVSTLITNELSTEINGVYLSLPCIVNSKGVARVLRLDYSSEEHDGLIESAKTLKKSIDSLGI